jgi:hypothetical protein
MIMKIAVLALNASMMAPVKSLGLRNLVGHKSLSNNGGEESEEGPAVSINDKPLDVASLGWRSLVSEKKSSPDNGGEESGETPFIIDYKARNVINVDSLAIINDKPDQGQRELQQIWCDPTSAAATPSWHPDYSRSWATSGCVLKSDCNQVGKATEAECCAAYYGGQRGGACVIAAGGPTVTQWYADYDTAWATAGCKSDFPYPIYASTFYDTQLACCKAAYAGQTSGACIGGLPSPPTTSPTSVGDLGKGWYADYGTSWNIAGCKNTLPRPIYVIVTYDTELQCCKAAYGGQSTDGCVQGLPNPPTKSPSKAPTNRPITSTLTTRPTTSTPTATPCLAPGDAVPTTCPVAPPGQDPAIGADESCCSNVCGTSEAYELEDKCCEAFGGTCTPLTASGDAVGPTMRSRVLPEDGSECCSGECIEIDFGTCVKEMSLTNCINPFTSDSSLEHFLPPNRNVWG